jgi:hypothetical protein
MENQSNSEVDVSEVSTENVEDDLKGFNKNTTLVIAQQLASGFLMGFGFMALLNLVMQLITK